MKLFVLMLFLVFSFSTIGCNTTSVGCAIQNGVVNTITPVIASGLQCSNPAAIQQTLNELGNKAGLCTAAAPQSVFGGACSLVANLLIDSLATAPIPVTWGCTATAAKEQLKVLVGQACGLLTPAVSPSPSMPMVPAVKK